MRQAVEKTGTGTSEVTKVFPGNPFNIGLGTVITGTVTYTIEHTFDGVIFYPHDDLVEQTGNRDGNYILPIAGIRINITSGSGKVVLTTLQAGG